MPNVRPTNSSPPPVSGNVEDTQHSYQAYSEIIHSLPTVIYNGTAAQKNMAQAVLLPPPGRLTQQNVLHTADVVVNDRPVEPPHRDICGGTSTDAAQECTHERKREEVIKEIALSSEVFIGPPCRPDTAIEKELSDFYKEIEELDQQDCDDGESFSQSCSPALLPATNPLPRKDAWVTDHKNTYRPYTATRPQRDNGRWRPQSRSDMTWDEPYNVQWQHPPPTHSHGPPKTQFQEPQQFFPPPPPGNPMPAPYFEPRFDNYTQADKSCWSSWDGPHFSLGYDRGLSSSNCSESYEQHERCPHAQQHYVEQTCYEQNQYQHNSSICLALILMRGVPGSGKSTLARQILSSGPNGLILSTDDYFFQEDGYYFDPTRLGDAHDWNQKRARDAMLECCSPVIIDNTNIQAWEMKPYVALALECGYIVEFVEPDTSWKCDPAELEKKNKHGVPQETIAKMLDRFERPINVDIVMNSCQPPHKSKEHVYKPRGQRR